MKWNGRWMQYVRVIVVEFILTNTVIVYYVSDTSRIYKYNSFNIHFFQSQNLWLSFFQLLNALRYEPTILPSVYSISLSDVIQTYDFKYLFNNSL